MFSKIFSRILFTVTTFLLLSASVLGLPMIGEGEADSSDVTARQNEARQQEENNRERAATTVDVTSLSRSMDDFHIAAETSPQVHPSMQQQSPTAASENETAALQAADLADRSDVMANINESLIPSSFNSVRVGGSIAPKSFGSPVPASRQKLAQVTPDDTSIEIRKRLLDRSVDLSTETPKRLSVGSFVTPDRSVLSEGASEENGGFSLV